VRSTGSTRSILTTLAWRMFRKTTKIGSRRYFQEPSSIFGSSLDPYDLALSKLERNIQRDRDDVLHLARTVPLDLEVLKDRYQKELRWQLGNPEREDLTLQLWIDAIEEERSKQ
jgi:hypothetical protein